MSAHRIVPFETLCYAQLALLQHRVPAEWLVFQQVKVWGLPSSKQHLEVLQALSCPQLVSWRSGDSRSINGREYIPLSHIPCVFFIPSVSILLPVVGKVLCYILSLCHEHVSWNIRTPEGFLCLPHHHMLYICGRQAYPDQ